MAAIPTYQMSGFGWLPTTEIHPSAGCPTHMAVGRSRSGHCHAGLA